MKTANFNENSNHILILSKNFQGSISSTSHMTFIHEDELLHQEISEIWESKLYSDLNILCLGDGKIVKTHQV